MIVSLPGVYKPQDDTSLLIEALSSQTVTAATRVLDLCSGTGALSIAAAKAGAGRVLAIDISRRAILNVRLNGVFNKASVEARRGDLTEAVHGEVFDLVVANPPYVPSEIDDLPTAGVERAWNAGVSGRALLDRIIASAPDMVAPGGSLLLLQSALCDVNKTEAMLEEKGMTVEVAARRSIPFGPVLRSRLAMLERRGLIEQGQETEELVVLRAGKPLASGRNERNVGTMSQRLPGEQKLVAVDTESKRRLHTNTELVGPSEFYFDTVEKLLALLRAMGFGITNTVPARTDVGIGQVFTLVPEGCVLVMLDPCNTGIEVSLQIEYVGCEVADYLRKHLPENISHAVRISTGPLARSFLNQDDPSARHTLERTGNE